MQVRVSSAIFRTASTTAILVIALAIVGAVSGPSWDPVVEQTRIKPATARTTIHADAPTTPIGTYRITTDTIHIQLDGVTVEAVVRQPVDAPERTAGVVFLHGAGTGDPHTAFVEMATDLASAGVATIVPAKRMDTYTLRHRDYVTMARDYARSVAALRARPGVDPARVGIYAESEGTWIAPVMAGDDPTLAFVALISAPVVPPRSQAAFAVGNYLRNTGVPQGVFRAIPRAVGMELPGGGFEYADFDVRPYLATLTMPVLVVYGTADQAMPIVQGTREILRITHEAGNEAVLVRFYAHADHGINVDGALSPDFPPDVGSWILGMPSSASSPPRIAGATPFQEYLASTVPQPRWFDSGNLIVGLVILAGALIGIGPVLMLLWGIVDRVRHRGGRDRGRTRSWTSPGFVAPELRVPLIGVVAASVLTTAGLVAYLVMIARLALDYTQDPWLVQGGWVGVRLMGITALVFAAMGINRIHDHRAARSELGTRSRLAHGIDGVVTLWAVPLGVGIYWVILTYWGVFQLGI